MADGSGRAGVFQLFVYGTLRYGARAGGLLAGCERVGPGTVRGVLYDIDGEFPAVLLYGGTVVHGEVWRCPAELLLRLDEYEGTGTGLFRRVGIEAELEDGGTAACWIYAAGPALARKLVAERRVDGGRWRGGRSDAPT
jgi:gamma-glutamylcyclotransferase (GGCT)/AIG2-like uncharacterized protein YtfP